MKAADMKKEVVHVDESWDSLSDSHGVFVAYHVAARTEMETLEGWW